MDWCVNCNVYTVTKFAFTFSNSKFCVELFYFFAQTAPVGLQIKSRTFIELDPRLHLFADFSAHRWQTSALPVINLW